MNFCFISILFLGTIVVLRVRLDGDARLQVASALSNKDRPSQEDSLDTVSNV